MQDQRIVFAHLNEAIEPASKRPAGEYLSRLSAGSLQRGKAARGSLRAFAGAGLLRFALGRFSVAALVCIAGQSLWVSSVSAEAFDAEAVRKQLRSGDAAELGEAFRKIRTAGPKAQPVVGDLNEVLRKGTSASLLVQGIEAAASIGDSSTSAVLAPYTRHRVMPVRQAAVKALVSTKGPDAVQALRAGLRSNDPAVRGLSATGLGSLKVKDAVPELLRALDYKVVEAAASVGKLCDAAACAELTGRLGKLPFDTMISGFDELWFRDDLADSPKLQLIEKLKALGTPQVGSYLRGVAGRWPAGKFSEVKKALDAALKGLGQAD